MAPIVRAQAEGAHRGRRDERGRGIAFDASAADVYYFAPQKNFASDGGLWLALVSPRRSSASSASRRAAATSRSSPAAGAGELAPELTPNTPALATLLLMEGQLD